VTALALGCGGLALLAVVACFVLGLKLSAAGRRETEAVQAKAEMVVATGEIAADRDRHKERADKAETQVADLTKRLLTAEEHVAELAAKLARQVIQRVKEQPPSQDGADAVNQLFSRPLSGKEKP